MQPTVMSAEEDVFSVSISPTPPNVVTQEADETVTEETQPRPTYTAAVSPVMQGNTLLNEDYSMLICSYM